MEAVNIGVLLLCPDLGFIQVCVNQRDSRVQQLFSGEKLDLERLDVAKRAIEHRVQVERERFRTRDDLVRFAETRGNDVVLTHPRPIKVSDPEKDLQCLFNELAADSG